MLPGLPIHNIPTALPSVRLAHCVYMEGVHKQFGCGTFPVKALLMREQNQASELDITLTVYKKHITISTYKTISV